MLRVLAAAQKLVLALYNNQDYMPEQFELSGAERSPQQRLVHFYYSLHQDGMEPDPRPAKVPPASSQAVQYDY